MELIELKANKRETKGKGAARKLRADKKIPAIVYGSKIDPVMLSLDTTDFERIIRENGTTGLFFNLSIDDGQTKPVMLKDMQMDTFGLNYVHVDLHAIDMDEKVTVTVPVDTTGESKGVKEGGLLQIIRRELDVQCKPADTPESVLIDITELEIGSSLHVEDIDMGEDIEIPHDVNFTVLTVVPPTTEEEKAEDELEEGEEGAVEDAVEAAEEQPSEEE